MKTEDIPDGGFFSPWEPVSNPQTVAILGKTLEEINELGKELARCLIQGPQETNPTTGEVNLEALDDELNDVEVLIYLVRQHLNLSPNSKRQTAKYTILSNWFKSLEAKPCLDEPDCTSRHDVHEKFNR